MALWSGTPSYATKKQLVSSISGIYDDLQDFSFSTISAVSTLTVSQWVSTPILYVSDIIGANIDISGIIISQDGVFNAPIVSLSSLSFKGLDKLLDLDVSFDLGLGDALGGLLGGLGALVGGATIAVGTGVGLAVQGAEQGIATMVAGRPQNFINSNVYETINFTTQLQVSTIGYAFPLYSTIRREVSSLAPDSIPGQEIFTSTFFTPGTTCIRSVSDPFNLISGNSNLNTSSLQSFGQWIPLPTSDTTPEFSTITILGSNLGTGAPPLTIETYGTAFNPFQIQIATTTDPVFQSYGVLPNPLDIAYSASNNSYYQRSAFPLSLNFISTPYVQFQSTFTNISPVYYLRSTISTPAQITYSNAGASGNIAICETNETGFRSTATFDFIAQGQDLFIQWGLGVDNLNSTIAANTGKRVSWDIPGAYSNFIDIPPVPSSIVGERITEFAFQSKPNEILFQAIDGTPFGPSFGSPLPLAFNVNSVTFGSLTTFSNSSNYPYQFNGNTFIDGILEANTIIALSSIVAVSTFAQTLFSTNIIEAASGIFGSTQTVKGHFQEGYISTLKASDNWANDYITTKSRVRMAGFQTPLSIVTGTFGNIYDYTKCFDFVTDTSPQAFYLESRPNNNVLMEVTSTLITIPNLNVGNLVADTLVYSNAEAPYLQTSTINFGWTGNFSYGGPVQYSLQQFLSTPTGTYWNNYVAASNQVLNIMNFNNQVNMLAQQFSTPLQYAANTTFGGSNREGWASTIFYNDLTTFARVNLEANAGPGELSLQAQTNSIAVSLNTLGGLGGAAIPVVVPSTLRFVSDGSQWNVSYIPPAPGNVSYSNTFQMNLDFENLNLTTTDTLNINAETINLNGQVVAPNLQLDNLTLNGFLSSMQVRADSINGYVSQANYSGPNVNIPFATPLNLQYTINSTDFTNIRATVTPSRGFNLFNSFNIGEWNNTQYNIDTTVAAGRPTMIVGEVLQLTPAKPPYSGQFWVNNAIDSPALVIPIYQNVEGVLNQIGSVSGNTYARVYTANGTQWFIQSNVPSPQGNANVTYTNYYQVQMTEDVTTINSGMPLLYNNPSLIYYNNKTTFYSPQIRVATIDAPSFNTREAGMEATSYYDGNISFSKIGATAFWESSAFNPILNMYQNTYYSVAGWMPTVSLTRLRISGNAISSWDLDATAYPVGGGATDYVWGTARYVKIITDELNPSGNLRESYTMIPKNYFNFIWQGQGPLN